VHRLSVATRNLRAFSADLAQWIPGETGADVVSRADDALYEARRRGRACVLAESSLLVRLSPQHELQGKHAP